MRQNDQKMRVE